MTTTTPRWEVIKCKEARGKRERSRATMQTRTPLEPPEPHANVMCEKATVRLQTTIPSPERTSQNFQKDPSSRVGLVARIQTLLVQRSAPPPPARFHFMPTHHNRQRCATINKSIVLRGIRVKSTPGRGTDRCNTTPYRKITYHGPRAFRDVILSKRSEISGVT